MAVRGEHLESDRKTVSMVLENGAEEATRSGADPAFHGVMVRRRVAIGLLEPSPCYSNGCIVAVRGEARSGGEPSPSLIVVGR